MLSPLSCGEWRKSACSEWWRLIFGKKIAVSIRKEYKKRSQHFACKLKMYFVSSNLLNQIIGKKIIESLDWLMRNWTIAIKNNKIEVANYWMKKKKESDGRVFRKSKETVGGRLIGKWHQVGHIFALTLRRLALTSRFVTRRFP